MQSPNPYKTNRFLMKFHPVAQKAIWGPEVHFCAKMALLGTKVQKWARNALLGRPASRKENRASRIRVQSASAGVGSKTCSVQRSPSLQYTGCVAPTHIARNPSRGGGKSPGLCEALYFVFLGWKTSFCGPGSGTPRNPQGIE